MVRVIHMRIGILCPFFFFFKSLLFLTAFLVYLLHLAQPTGHCTEVCPQTHAKGRGTMTVPETTRSHSATILATTSTRFTTDLMLSRLAKREGERREIYFAHFLFVGA